jgi:hypothetical protein
MLFKIYINGGKNIITYSKEKGKNRGRVKKTAQEEKLITRTIN